MSFPVVIEKGLEIILLKALETLGADSKKKLSGDTYSVFEVYDCGKYDLEIELDFEIIDFYYYQKGNKIFINRTGEDEDRDYSMLSPRNKISLYVPNELLSYFQSFLEDAKVLNYHNVENKSFDFSEKDEDKVTFGWSERLNKLFNVEEIDEKYKVYLDGTSKNLNKYKTLNMY